MLCLANELQSCADSHHCRNDWALWAVSTNQTVYNMQTHTTQGDDVTHMCYLAVLRLHKTDTFKGTMLPSIAQGLGTGRFSTPWYSRVEQKPSYESLDAKAHWDVPECGELSHLLQNRVDTWLINHKKKTAKVRETSYLWLKIKWKRTRRIWGKMAPWDEN